MSRQRIENAAALRPVGAGRLVRGVRHVLVAALATLMASIVLCVLLIGFVTVLLARGPLEVPQARDFVQARLNTQLVDETLTIGAVLLDSDANGLGNSVVLRDVELTDEEGDEILSVPEVRTQFALRDLMRGAVAPERVEISGTKVALERLQDGTFKLFSSAAPDQTSDSVLQTIDRLARQTSLKNLAALVLVDTEIALRDHKTGRRWALNDSTLQISRDGDQLTGRAEIKVEEAVTKLGLQPKDPAKSLRGSTKLVMGAEYTLGSGQSQLSFQFAQANPADIANLFEAFDWLRALDSKISGSVRAELSGAGKLGNLNGVLDLEQGVLRETPDNQPVSFETAKVYFDYQPDVDTLNFTQLALQTSSGSVQAEGFAQLTRGSKGAVVSMAGQLRLRNITVLRPDLFEGDLSLDAAALDFRLSLSPLMLDVGQLTVFDGASIYRASGRSVAGRSNWVNSYDLSVDKMDHSRLLALWPIPAVPKTRLWIEENVSSATIRNFHGSVRSDDKKPQFAFNFEIEDAGLRFMKTMPHLQNGRGFGYLTQQDIRLDLTQGTVMAPDNTPVDVAGTSLFIPDIHQNPTPGEITLNAKGGIQAALHLLDVEKFRFISKAGLKPDLADGAVVIAGEFLLPLEKDAKKEEVKFDLRAELLNVRSTELIEDRTLTARRLVALVTDEGMTIEGQAELDRVPLNGKWTQSFDKRISSTSTVDAQVSLSASALDTFGIGLPKGSVSGATSADLTLTITKGAPPAFDLSSNLQGAGLSISALNWRKPAKSQGRLTVSGTLGARPTVDKLALSAAGLSASGTLTLSETGKLERLDLPELKVGRWLDTSATLIPRGNQSDITLRGGAADLRFLGASSGGAGSSGTAKVDLLLDKLVITPDLTLTNFTGAMTTKGGLRGDFVGRVNGGSRINAKMFPQKHGSAFEVTSKDAGGVMESARLLKNAKGGDLRLILVPQKGSNEYDGSITVKRTRLRNASAMAGLLNAISLVGLLQQLEGEGIHFSSVEGQFKMRDNGVQLKNISAVGPSMGMTLDGWYSTRQKSVDFEGVITPLYAVNGVFERLFGPLMGRRKGEGMFSFTYRMRGPAANPKVGVNPLSILTPGAFREIFRQKVPVPTTE